MLHLLGILTISDIIDPVDVRLYSNSLPLWNYGREETFEEASQETKPDPYHAADDVAEGDPKDSQGQSECFVCDWNPFERYCWQNVQIG